MKNLLGALLACTCLASAQTPANWRTVDWKRQQPEVLQHYRSLIQIDSSNPPGNETKVAEYLKKVLESAGIPTQTFSNDPTRANLVARIKGNGTKRPLLIMAHTDVAGTQREKRPVDPFGAIMKHGYICARGSNDATDKLAAMLNTQRLITRNQASL